MSARIRAHLQSNVVGYIALFFVLTGGTAYALDGSDTVFSDDIVDGEVHNVDIASNAIGTNKIADSSILPPDIAANTIDSSKVADGSLQGNDLANGAVGGQKISTNGVSSANILDGGIFGVDIADGAVQSADIGNGTITGSDLGTHSVGLNTIDPAAFNSSDIGIANGQYGVADNAIQGQEVSADTLTNADIAESTLDTPEAAYARRDASFELPTPGSSAGVVWRTVEPGSYVVFAKASLFSDDGDFATCKLEGQHGNTIDKIDTVEVPTVKASFGLPGAWGEVSLMGVISAGANIELTMWCGASDAGLDIRDSKLVAMKVNRLISTDATKR